MSTLRDTQTTSSAGTSDLLTRLISQIFQLYDNELALAKLEMKQHVESLAHTAILFVAGGFFATIGILLLANAGALALGRAIDSLIGGYLIVGGVIAVASFIVIGVARSRLARLSLAPTQTIAEIRRDMRWISHETERRSA
jgi:hypothetical protein